MNRRTHISLLIDLAAQLRRDEDLPLATRRRRDRQIGAVTDKKRRPAEQLGAWLESVSDAHAHASPGQRYASAHRVGLGLLSIIGLVAGGLAATAVFQYDGTHPVNVIRVLAIFVGLQILLMLLLGLTVLPTGLIRILPGVRTLQESLTLLNPGRLRGMLLRRFPDVSQHGGSDLAGGGRRHCALFGRVEKWAILLTGQVGAVGFNLGALLACLYMIVFSDLAFSWGTTLDVDSADFHAIISVLARPWSAWLPAAMPGLDLIEASRHFRLQVGYFPGVESPHAVNPLLLGGWWPFLVCAMVCYGLGPRLVALWVSTWRFRQAVDYAVCRLPGAREVLHRLNDELVETAAVEPETMEAGGEGEEPASPAESWKQLPYDLIVWSESLPGGGDAASWAEKQWGRPPEIVAAAGGSRSLEEDRQAMVAVGQSGDRHAVVLVKGWEPPVAECLDFLRELRDGMGDGGRVVVVPLGLQGRPSPDADRSWRHGVQRIGDPWIRVRPAEEAT